jgi:hypothetical protein
MPLEQAVQRALEGFLASTAFQPSNGEVESVEVVEVVEVEETSEPGIRLTWHQGQHAFGLLIPITRLAYESGGLDQAPWYLRLAVDEPHEPAPNGERRWFSDLPSGPY